MNPEDGAGAGMNARAEYRIEAANLRKKFGQIEALRGITFGIRGGEIYGLLGPNGAGKSTTVGILCGLVAPDAGAAHLNGIDVGRQPVEARRSLGVVPQELALYLELSARDNLSFFGRLYGLGGSALRERIDHILARVNLTERTDEPIERYSGGMLRRLNIAAGLLHDPKAVLLDEPTVGLDPQTRLSILEVVRSIAAAGAAVLYTTHYLDEAERLCDRIGIIDKGAILAEGTLAQLREVVGEREIVAFRGSFRADAIQPGLRTLARVDVIKAEENEVLLSVDNAERQLSASLAAVNPLGEIREVAVKQPSLENLFIKLTGRELRE
jgi:ABC-2 type transport system ATP-binding protein